MEAETAEGAAKHLKACMTELFTEIDRTLEEIDTCMTKCKTVFFDPQIYHACPDGLLMEEAEKLISRDSLFTSSEDLVSAIRVLIRRGLIDHKAIEFHIGGECFQVDKHGKWIDNPPFPDVRTSIYLELL